MSTKAGYVHSIDTAGMVDGPGIRYLIFLSGCALRCKYCHNPDTWNMKTGRLMTVEEIITDIRKYKSYLKFSGGGVTVTGGDPLVQFAFLEALLAACKAEGFHTAIDTSGYATPQTVERVLTHTDLLLLDIKSINPVTYEAVTGVPLDRTLETLRISRSLGIETWIRYVLVPGLTDSTRDMYRLAKFLQPFQNITKIEVIPFHKVGEYKWKDLGRKYELWDTPAPSQDMLDIARRILAR
ncbi:MAG: pyruvate formate-lyase-activating protein [Defluviitaleaceae bacterium]|nr:pyruvate formate-lyase-activating protein [Defluviitaleaceae bacterium]